MVEDYMKFTYIVYKNKIIRIWHYQLEYVSNTRVVRVSKLVDRINISNSIE